MRRQAHLKLRQKWTFEIPKGIARPSVLYVYARVRDAVTWMHAWWAPSTAEGADEYSAARRACIECNSSSALSERRTSLRRSSIGGHRTADSAAWPVWQSGDEEVARGCRAGGADGIDAAAQGKNCIFVAAQRVVGGGRNAIAGERGRKSFRNPGDEMTGSSSCVEWRGSRRLSPMS